MFRGFLLGIIVTIIVIAGAIYAVLRLGTIPAGANSDPLPLEHWAAGTALRATLEREAPKGPNPVPLTDANLIAGIQLYGTHCAFCHGTAEGDAAMTAVAKGENPAPPQLATETVTNDPEGWTFWKIKNGIRWSGMPAWQGTLNDHQIWTIALFLKHIEKLPPAAQQVWQGVKN
jgi:mono/diheme cytochrome c family protein